MSETLHVLQLLKGLDIGGASGGSDKYGFELSLALKKAGVHVMVGVVDGANDDSLAFHRKLGFVESGRLPQVGRKFDRWLDVVFMTQVL